ncbi:MAG: FAD-binding oxidoreductase [Desulfurococcales archaeon]|nr:FAD-binding oxidoreductase [Desulfurococcales archaeon]
MIPRFEVSHDIPERVGIIVVGGGAAGVGVAFGLASLGYTDVVVLERGYIGYGSSTRNAGRFRVHFFSKENTVFAAKSREIILEIAKKARINPVIVPGGYLWLFEDEGMFKRFIEFNEHVWKPLGYPVRLLGIDDLSERYPYLNVEGLVGSALGVENGSYHHDYLLLAQAVYAYERGVRFIEGAHVDEVIVEAGRVKGVRVRGHGTVYADNVVIAAGAWSKELVSKIGIDIPAHPQRKSLLVTEPYKFMIEPLVIFFEEHGYIGQTLKGEIIASKGYPGEPRDSDYSKIEFKWLVETSRLVAERLKGGSRLRPMRIWSGAYYVTPDHSHILGRDDEWPEGLYINTGYSGHGMMMAPYAGILLARLIVDGIEHEDLKPFKPTRFKEGKLIHEGLVIG